MRQAIFESATQVDPDEQLSTGEAAKILNSSRQHVVDLCRNGQLPFTTVGTHRRVRRGDVEAILHRTERLSADQQRSLWLAFAVAGRIVSDPESALSLATSNIEKMKSIVRGSAGQWVIEWEKLLTGPLEMLLSSLTSRNLRGRELRQHSPFAGLLSDDERIAIHGAWRASRESKSPKAG